MKRRAFVQRGLLAGVALLVSPLGVAEASSQQLNTKTVEVYHEGQWLECPWEDLKKDRIFRLRLPDGTIEGVGTEDEVSISTGDSFLQDNGVWGVLADPFTWVSASNSCWDRVLCFVLPEDVTRGVRGTGTSRVGVMGVRTDMFVLVPRTRSAEALSLQPSQLDMSAHTVTFTSHYGDVTVPLQRVRILPHS